MSNTVFMMYDDHLFQSKAQFTQHVTLHEGDDKQRELKQQINLPYFTFTSSILTQSCHSSQKLFIISSYCIPPTYFSNIIIFYTTIVYFLKLHLSPYTQHLFLVVVSLHLYSWLYDVRRKIITLH